MSHAARAWSSRGPSASRRGWRVAGRGGRSAPVSKPRDSWRRLLLEGPSVSRRRWRASSTSGLAGGGAPCGRSAPAPPGPGAEPRPQAGGGAPCGRSAPAPPGPGAEPCPQAGGGAPCGRSAPAPPGPGAEPCPQAGGGAPCGRSAPAPPGRACGALPASGRRRSLRPCRPGSAGAARPQSGVTMAKSGSGASSTAAQSAERRHVADELDPGRAEVLRSEQAEGHGGERRPRGTSTVSVGGVGPLRGAVGEDAVGEPQAVATRRCR